jgi:hypothetical protein
MAASRERFRRHIGQLLLLALLVVPLRLSAHVHPDRPTPSSSCSICTVASHWVAEQEPPHAVVEPVLLTVRVAVARPDSVSAVSASVHLGRAPPPTTHPPL